MSNNRRRGNNNNMVPSWVMHDMEAMTGSGGSGRRPSTRPATTTAGTTLRSPTLFSPPFVSPPPSAGGSPSLASYDARDLTSGETGTLSTPGSSAALVTPSSATARRPRLRTAINFNTPVTAGNVLQELRLVEVRLLEIAAVVSGMDVDTASVERGMLRRIMDSLSSGGDDAGK